jgi:hypothetical protein
MKLNNWYDQRYPAPRGTVKLQGELERVRGTVLTAMAIAGSVCAGALIPIIRRWLPRQRGRGFEVIDRRGRT